MALVDVTELLVDPDLVNPMSIVHRTPTVNALGENVLVETTVVTIGSIQPAGEKTLMRLPEAFQVQDVSNFWVKGVITSDGTTAYPDLLVFNGLRYQVQTIQDFMNWGAGYCLGTCIRERPTL